MPKGDSNLAMLIVAALVAIGVGYYVPKTFVAKPAEKAIATTSTAETPAKTAPAGKAVWAASAPGRVEPANGEIRIGALAPGRITEVLVAVNDKVVAGDLLVRLDDEDQIARLNAAAAEALIRKRERDANDAVGRPAQDRRVAEDAVASAERQLMLSRDDLDRALKARGSGATPEVDLGKARDGVSSAKDKLSQARATLRKALSVDGLPAPTRPETALVAARAELSIADAALERTRIRAPSSGTVLQVSAKVGETAAPSPENVLLMLGDVSSLRVRAEFEERDIGKVRVGQGAVIRSDAFPNKDFNGKVATVAQSLGPSRLSQRGPRRPTDVDVLEAFIDLAGQTFLLPGMRVDVYLKPEAAAAQPAAAASDTAPVSKVN